VSVSWSKNNKIGERREEKGERGEWVSGSVGEW